MGYVRDGWEEGEEDWVGGWVGDVHTVLLLLLEAAQAARDLSLVEICEGLADGGGEGVDLWRGWVGG